jgi:hypothetical protein
MCVGVLPVASVPLWQLKQAPATLSWFTLAGVHADVVWQFSQLLLEGMWLAGFAVTGPVLMLLVPLWQPRQLPTTCAWSTATAGCHVLVSWQLSQVFEVGRCALFLPWMLPCVPS